MTNNNDEPPRKRRYNVEPIRATHLLNQVREQQSAIQRIADAVRLPTQLQDAVLAATKVLDAHPASNRRFAKVFGSITNSPLTKIDLVNTGLVTKPMLNMGKLNAAMGLPVIKCLDTTALNTALFARSFTSELMRFQTNVAGITHYSSITALARQYDQYRAPNILALSNVLRASALALVPHGEAFARMAKEESTANFILELGFVPHEELWDHFAEVQYDDDSTRDRAARIATECWPRLSERLALSTFQCLNDPKLERLYQQMLAAHDRGDYEIVLTGMPSALERCVRLAVPPSHPQRSVIKWIREDVVQLPISIVGGIRGFRVWKILVEHTFASFQTDQDADAIMYPNRHVVSHGAGAVPTDVVKSLNAILLTHFLIRIANAVIDYNASDAA